MQEYWVTAKKLGEILDTSYRNIENWAANGNIKQNREGKYGLISAYKYKLKDLNSQLASSKEKIASLEAVEDEEVNLIKIRKLKAETNKEEAIARIKNLEADEKAGLLVDAEDVLVGWQNLIASCKAKLLAMPAKLALELSGLDNPKDIQARLTSVIDEALKELIN